MPLRETAFQADTFLALAAAGFLAAFFYDLAGPALRSGSFWAHLAADLPLCAVTAGLCFLALAATGQTAPRLYMPFSFAAGAALYRLGPRRAAAGAIKMLTANRKKPKHSE